MSSRSQGTKNRHAARKHRSGRKRGAKDATTPALARSSHGHAAPTPAQFGARAPLASRPAAPDVPSLSLRGHWLAPEMRQAQPSRIKAKPVAARHQDSPAPEPVKAPKITSAIVRPMSAPGMAHLSISFRMSRNGPPLLERARDEVAGITAACPQGSDAFASAETVEGLPASPAVMPEQATPAPAEAYLHTSPDDTAAPALPLPRQTEPLAEPLAAPQRIPQSPDASCPLPRHLAPAKPSEGLWGAMGHWLRSAGQMLASGFMVKKTRPRTPSPATMREQAELTQLRAENRRLRTQLNGMMQARTPDARMMDRVPG
ncbi:hypothetical protein [Novosphingobium rosa]|uniref:hypothetical protein n=1 Tax=Novosphingobium rosa TaxID=76978 RepID=UPI00082DF70B|nr:hypothetical protein [Novosphingobium rosa]